MEEAVGSGKTKHTFGVYTEGKFCTFTLREETLMDRLIEGRSADWKRLDVAILHAAILERLLGIDARALDGTERSGRSTPGRSRSSSSSRRRARRR